MKTLEEIEKIREEKRKELDLRVNSKANTYEKHILVCHGTGCTSSKSPQILENFRRILKEKNIDNVRVIMTGCFGLCSKGPIVIIRPEETFYEHVKPEDCEEIIESHICQGKRVERLLSKDIDGSIVDRLDEVKLVSVPSVLMKTAYDFKDTGFAAKEDAKNSEDTKSEQNAE